MASTKNQIPRARHAAPMAARSKRCPLQKLTHESATTFTRGSVSIARISAPSSGSSPARGSNRCSAPRARAAAIHGYTFAGNSPCVERMTSPFPYGRARAARFTPCVVLVIRAIDFVLAPMSRAARSRATASDGNSSSVRRRNGSARFTASAAIASRERCGIGPVEA